MNNSGIGLADPFGRTFNYLRLSITDVCNFRCVYCLPKGYVAEKCGSIAPDSLNPFLTPIEIQNLLSAFTTLGVTKVRLTGGEPTVRADILEIARVAKQVSGIHTLALTTNGYRLKALASSLKEAGVDQINVSVDSLTREGFRSITGMDRRDGVLAGVRAAQDAGFESIKINVVLMKGLNDQDIDAYLHWARTEKLSIRFIELMQTRSAAGVFEQAHLSLDALRSKFVGLGFSPKSKSSTDGPALEYGHPNYAGSVGLISPYQEGLCDGCNRLRVSAKGALRLCLFGDGNQTASLRDLLQSPDQQSELLDRVRTVLKLKPEAHGLRQGRLGNIENLSQIGG
ncbi:GTP 3',8-cyclase MoaA [Bdellovibrionota bacterium FG-2]